MSHWTVGTMHGGSYSLATVLIILLNSMGIVAAGEGLGLLIPERLGEGVLAA